MKQAHFVQIRTNDWVSLQNVLEVYESNKSLVRHDAEEFVKLYRDVSRDLAIARSRNYSTELINRLNDLAVRGHNAVYRSQSGYVAKVMEFITRDFPAEVRRQWKVLLFASCAFLIPAIAVAALIVQDNGYVHSVLSPQQVESIEKMYDPSGGEQNDSDGVRSRLGAFGFYIYNNASIGLQCAGSGLFFGIGTVAILVRNGLAISAILTHLVVIGYGERLFSFVAGHSAFELSAIVISGAAGLRLGQALLAPGPVSRTTAIRRARRPVVILAFGAMIMFFVAAFIEAFWSATQLPSLLKYCVGIVLWVLVIIYFVFGGKNGIREGSN